MNKKLNEASRLRGVPSVGTELRMPDNMPPLFPEITCTEATGIANEFLRQGATDKSGLSLLWHIGDEDGDHLPDCPTWQRIETAWLKKSGAFSNLQNNLL